MTTAVRRTAKRVTLHLPLHLEMQQVAIQEVFLDWVEVAIVQVLDFMETEPLVRYLP
jgi:hypothetical protein